MARKNNTTDASARARFDALVAQMDKAIANIGRRKVTDKDQTISIPAGAGATRVPTIGGSEVRRVSVSVAIPMDAATQRALTAALDSKCLGAAGRAAAAKLIAHIITNAPDAVTGVSFGNGPIECKTADVDGIRTLKDDTNGRAVMAAAAAPVVRAARLFREFDTIAKEATQLQADMETQQIAIDALVAMGLTLEQATEMAVQAAQAVKH